MPEYQIDEGLRQEYEAIKGRYLAQGHIIAIKECATEVFDLPLGAMLEACGVTGCTPIEYLSPNYDAAAPGNDKIAGKMIGVETAKGRRAVILMRRDYPSEMHPAFVTACKVCVLYHELGHAHDFNEGINFRHRERGYNAEKAEAYADAFAQEKLKKIKCVKIVNGKKVPTTLWDWYRQSRYRGEFVS